MKNTHRLSKWARVVAPALLAVTVIGCSISGPVGPVGNNSAGPLDDAQPTISDDRNVDQDRNPEPQKLDEESNSMDEPRAIISIDRSVDRNRLPEPQKLDDKGGSIMDSNELPPPDATEDLKGRIVETDEVPSDR